MLSTTPTTGDEAYRAASLAGLMIARDFLAAHPELPVGIGHHALQVCVYGGTHEENIAEVDRIAAVLGAEAGPSGGGTYAVRHDFGGSVYYTASYLVPVEKLLEAARAAETAAAA